MSEDDASKRKYYDERNTKNEYAMQCGDTCKARVSMRATSMSIIRADVSIESECGLVRIISEVAQGPYEYEEDLMRNCKS